MELTDRNGNEIKLGQELTVPLDVFSNGYVVLNKDNDLSLELKYESKKVPLKHLNKNLFNSVEIINN